MLKWIIFLLIVFAGVAVTATEDTVTIATGNYPPYSMEENNGSGITIEITRRAFELVGLKTKFEFYPWNRTEKLTLDGKAFGALPYLKTLEREMKFDFSDPLLKTRAVFFYYKSNTRIPRDFQWHTLDDFRSYIMGGTLGYWYIDSFKKAHLNVIYTGSDETGFTNLKNGRIDFVLMSELTGWEMIKKNHPQSISQYATLSKPESEADLYLMISKKYPNAKVLKDRFNKGLKILHDSGEFDRIVARYNIKR